MPEKIINAELGTRKLVTCPSCFGKNRLDKRSTKSSYRCGNCRNQLSQPFGLSTSKTQSTLKRSKIVGFGIFIGVGLGFLVSPFAEASHSPSALSAPATSQPETPPNQPIIIPELPSPLLSQIIEPLVTQGRGSLEVSNGTSSDAYIKLIDPLSRTLVAGFYVKSNSSFTLEEIPDGNYEVLFVSGEDWDSNTQTFTRSPSYTKFDNSFDFITTQLTDRIEYSIHRITLHQVLEGNATTSEVDKQEFAEY